MKNFVTFGEIMMRLTPPAMLRFGQARSFDVAYGGGEANVSVSLANFGLPTQFVTCIPANDIGEAALQYLRQYQVGTQYVQRSGSRLGIYYMESGAVMRASQVIYDRANSSFACVKPGSIDWRSIFSDAQWFHWTGITPAISESAAAVCLEAVKIACEMGVTVSCDLNYRAKLWKWGKPAGEVMRELVQYSSVLIGNEEDADKVFGIQALETDILAGEVSAGQYGYVCGELSRQFPGLKQISITLRGSLSASHNTWSGILWDQGQLYEGPRYDITHIIDRVGGGDSFMGGLIYGLSQFGGDMQKTIDFAVAASALKHTIVGDFNLMSVKEVEKLLAGDASGRVSR